MSPTIYADNATKKVMNNALLALIKLVPFYSDDLKFSDPKNAKLITDNIAIIKTSFKTAKHLKQLKKDGFAPSYLLLNDHIQKIEESYKNGNTSFSRIQLANTLSLCLSCHTQISDSKKPVLSLKAKFINRSDFEADKDYADYLYLTRKYDIALTWYKKSIEQRIVKQNEFQKMLGNNSGNWGYVDKELISSYKNLLSIYLKIYTNPKDAYDFLNTQTKLIKSKFIKSILENWSDNLKVWINKKYDFKSKDIANQIIKDVESLNEAIGLYNDVEMLLLSGVVGRALNANPTKDESPKYLLWMGKSALHLNKSLFYDLGDFYLINCIEKYPKSKYSKECFQVLKENTEFSYSGSGGVFIPKDKLNQLKKLKKMVK